VNYGQWRQTAALTRQVLSSDAGRQGTAEVVIVDNHSPPHQLVKRLRRWDGVSLRRWRANHGFARAVNEGCRLSRGRWFLLLNPDVTLEPGFIDGALALVDQLTSNDPRTGVVGFHLRNPDGSLQLSSGQFPTLTSTLARLLLPRAQRKYTPPPANLSSLVAWVTGCCLLLGRDCLQDVGGFDERFFLYYEDVDLCRRAQQRGWRVRYDATLRATHHSPLHSRRVSPALRVYTRHALLTYADKHWRRWEFLLLACLVCGETRVRRLRAYFARDKKAVTAFQALTSIADHLMRGSRRAARRLLRRFVRLQQIPFTWPQPIPSVEPAFERAKRPHHAFEPRQRVPR
jgi:GT2 family glycosyltransferase